MPHVVTDRGRPLHEAIRELAVTLLQFAQDRPSRCGLVRQAIAKGDAKLIREKTNNLDRLVSMLREAYNQTSLEVLKDEGFAAPYMPVAWLKERAQFWHDVAAKLEREAT